MSNPTDPDPESITFSFKLDPQQLQDLMRQGKGLVIPARALVSQKAGPTPGFELAPPRSWPQDKQTKELAVAGEFVRVLERAFPDMPRFEGDLAPGGDPPDVVGVQCGNPVGIEIGEIRDPDKTSGSVRLKRFTDRVTQQLAGLRPKFRGQAFRVHYLDPLQANQPLPARAHDLNALAEAVVAGMERSSELQSEETLPPPLRAIAPAGFTTPDRVGHPDDPLVIHDADLDPIVPWVAQEVVRRVAEKKVGVSTDTGTQYLLLWSDTSEFFALFGLVCESVHKVLEAEAEIPYDCVFLFDCHLVGAERIKTLVVHPSKRRR